MSNKTVISGKFSEATIQLQESEIEESVIDQIQDTVNHPAFQNEIVVMPDCHYGKGCTIGFTMPVTDRVCPNTVGVDIGCGMCAFRLDEKVDIGPESSQEVIKEVDEKIRYSVPTGNSVNDRSNYHMKNDFPWDEVQRKWERFSSEQLNDNIELGPYDPDNFTYDIEYFKKLCNKVGFSLNRAINSVGSLGGGNHFIELSQDDDGRIWGVVHSGSRGLGYNIAEYHQDRAIEIRNSESVREALNMLPEKCDEYIRPNINRVSDDELHQWVHNKQIVDYDKLREDYEGTEKSELIEEIKDLINKASRLELSGIELAMDGASEDIKKLSDEGLSYLEGDESVEYYVDMAFAQTYAKESRIEMATRVSDVLEADIAETIHSVHNYIDYKDGILRKGATPAREGQKGIIPMNMSYGSFIFKGKGNSDWNNSAPHGAGRRMSRTQAHDDLDADNFEERMGDTFASELPLDEAPMAYKNVELIRSNISPTVELTNHLQPFLNIKAA